MDLKKIKKYQKIKSICSTVTETLHAPRTTNAGVRREPAEKTRGAPRRAEPGEVTQIRGDSRGKIFSADEQTVRNIALLREDLYVRGTSVFVLRRPAQATCHVASLSHLWRNPEPISATRPWVSGIT